MRSIVFVDSPRAARGLGLILGLTLAASASAQVRSSEVRAADPPAGSSAGGLRSTPGSTHERLNLVVGEQKVLDSDGVRNFSEGVKGIIDIRLTKDNERFVIVGLRPGKTTLLFIMIDGSQIHYDVTVSDPHGQASSEAPEARGGVPARDNVRLDFYFVQLTNSYNHAVGIGWPTSVTGEGVLNVGLDLQSGVLSSATAVITAQALPRLDFAQSDGFAKLVRKAAVVTANGTQATFLGGGEVNVALTGGFGGSVKQIRFGSEIGVLPRYDKETGRIELEITADVSDLTPDNGTGAPGRVISTLQTVVNLELGQSLVLAGLTSASEQVSKTGIPGLSQIPIFGALFGTHTEQSAETQNVVFIVPTVIDLVSMQQRAHIDEALRAYDDFNGSLDHHKPLLSERRPGR